MMYKIITVDNIETLEEEVVYDVSFEASLSTISAILSHIAENHIIDWDRIKVRESDAARFMKSIGNYDGIAYATIHCHKQLVKEIVENFKIYKNQVEVEW